MCEISNCCETESRKNLVTEQRQSIPSLLEPAPYWSSSAVVHTKIEEISLNDYKGKYLILLFYPQDFTFVCPTELIQFSERIKEFRSLDSEVVAVSTDSIYTHYVWITTPRKQGGLGQMNIPFLSDKSHKISRDYGVLNENTGTALRALFVIDDKQIIRQVSLNDCMVARSVDEALRLIQASQFVDQYGDVCPVGPKIPRKKSVPDPKKYEEYFNT
ncbi:peroxiredoxin 1-like [Cephus cinctus]|uniref:thioredoxin-dependent peroxiredoxin n=1 Tax=Cephus cinctus TaxID=211228 RepID=A0AAJ7FIX3_CEPCN|nr:peroxiredoxin 1-like [Cephus cinctus]